MQYNHQHNLVQNTTDLGDVLLKALSVSMNMHAQSIFIRIRCFFYSTNQLISSCFC